MIIGLFCISAFFGAYAGSKLLSAGGSMLLLPFEKLPAALRTPQVKKYYDILDKKRFSLFFKRVTDIKAEEAPSRRAAAGVSCVVGEDELRRHAPRGRQVRQLLYPRDDGDAPHARGHHLARVHPL